MLHAGIQVVFLSLLLIVAGDVELNPGPLGPTRGAGSSRTTRQARLTTSGELETEDRLDDATCTEIHSMQGEVSRLKSLVLDCCESVKRLEKENRDLRQKVDDLENQSRCDSLVFYGIPESSDGRETWEMRENKVCECIREQFGMQNVDEDRDLQIERAHRVGRKLAGKTRPIVARFTRWKDKQTVLEKAREKACESQNKEVNEETTTGSRVRVP